MEIIECSRTPQSEVRARRYGYLSRTMSRDNALLQQWPGSGSQDCLLGLPRFRQAKFPQYLPEWGKWREQINVRHKTTSTQNLDYDGVVGCEHQRSYKEVIVFWICWGLPAPVAKENVYLASTLGRITKVSWRWRRALPKVLRGLYEWGSVAAKSTRGQTARPSWALAQCKGIVA